MKNITFDEIKNSVLEALSQVAPLIKFVGDNPEVGYKEEKACKCQADYLEKIGFAVDKGVADIATAFKGKYSAVKNDNGVNVALLTEYDNNKAPSVTAADSLLRSILLVLYFGSSRTVPSERVILTWSGSSASTS